MSQWTIRIGLLGALGVRTADGRTLSPILPGKRAELVFAYLAAEHHRIVSRDELADALWPSELPSAWAAAVRCVVSDVRQFLTASGFDGNEVLVTARGGYGLRLPAGTQTDLDIARAGLVQARESLAVGETAAAAQVAAEIAKLCQLPFIPAHDCAWAEEMRRELASLRLQALEMALRAQASLGETHAAAGTAELLVRANPYDESAHQLRIRTLGNIGDRAGAMLAYQHCRDVLAQDLGTEPGDETQSTLQRALAGTVPAMPGIPRNDWSGINVLVVDTDDYQRRAATRVLRRLGIGTVAEARSSKDALRILQAEPRMDVTICDIEMDGMDGVEFLRRLAQLRAHNSVILASLLGDRLMRAVQTIASGYGLTVLGCLDKPLSVRRLERVLGSYTPPERRRDQGKDERAAAKLRRALDAGHLSVLFEPAVDIVRGQLVLVSALPALPSDARPVPLEAVAAVLKSPDEARRFTDQLLAATCSAARAWKRTDDAVATHIALPSAVVRDITFPDRAASFVAGAGVPAALITWSVSHAALRYESALFLDALTRLRLKGFGVSLTVREPATIAPNEPVPITSVRLHRRVVTGASESPRRLTALEAALASLRSLRVPVLAEGCDREDDFEALLELGCDVVQGRFIGEAMPGSEVRPWKRVSPLLRPQDAAASRTA
jgi:DNA-binding SARP family transcriptional activator/EAL domain-containing protein (putative c-di-GMP-specific phosphodiesterase class I)/ActR/RegA family two-component response regulator